MEQPSLPLVATDPEPAIRRQSATTNDRPPGHPLPGSPMGALYLHTRATPPKQQRAAPRSADAQVQVAPPLLMRIVTPAFAWRGGTPLIVLSLAVTVGVSLTLVLGIGGASGVSRLVTPIALVAVFGVVLPALRRVLAADGGALIALGLGKRTVQKSVLRGLRRGGILLNLLCGLFFCMGCVYIVSFGLLGNINPSYPTRPAWLSGLVGVFCLVGVPMVFIWCGRLLLARLLARC